MNNILKDIEIYNKEELWNVLIITNNNNSAYAILLHNMYSKNIIFFEKNDDKTISKKEIEEWTQRRDSFIFVNDSLLKILLKLNVMEKIPTTLIKEVILYFIVMVMELKKKILIMRILKIKI